jgi:hypothetical protein
METAIPANLIWFKAQKSNSGNGCVQAARMPDGGMAVRHSQRPGGGVLVFSGAEWGRVLHEATTGAASGYVTYLPHGGVTFRRGQSAGDTAIEYSEFEWDCFRDGAIKGEFDLPTARV